MITTAGRTKLVLLAGVTLVAVVLRWRSLDPAQPRHPPRVPPLTATMVAAFRPRRTVTTAPSRSTAPRRRWLTGATSHTCVRSTLTPSALTQPSQCPGRSSRGRRPVTAPLPHPARCHWTATALATPPIWGCRTGITSCCGTSRAKRAPPSRRCSGWRAARRPGRQPTIRSPHRLTAPSPHRRDPPGHRHLCRPPHRRRPRSAPAWPRRRVLLLARPVPEACRSPGGPWL